MLQTITSAGAAARAHNSCAYHVGVAHANDTCKSAADRTRPANGERVLAADAALGAGTIPTMTPAVARAFPRPRN